MSTPRQRKPIDSWNGRAIPAGDSYDVELAVSESYSSMTVRIPIHIRRAKKEGPVVFVTAALHGDEINGTGAVRQLIQDDQFKLRCGTIILVPVLNILAFDRHSRYLPDRRDLNRSFPGTTSGTLAGRMAKTIFDEIVSRSDYGIDLHTAAVRRTNYPNIRADLSDPDVARIAEAFGCEVMIDNKGPQGSFRRESCRSGCPTIIMEGGEVWKVEPTIVEVTARGIKNVLRALDMLDGESDTPDHQIVVKKSKWIRSERGGFLQFHVNPGQLVKAGQPLATNTTLLGREFSVLESPFDAVVLGMTTLPATSPGEPVCNLGKLPKGSTPSELRTQRTEEHGLEERLTEDLASNVMIFDPSK